MSQALEAFLDVTVTGQDDSFKQVYQSLLRVAATHPSRLAGVLHLPLVIADVIRRAYAEEIAASMTPLTVSDERCRELVSIDTAAASAACAMFNAFQTEFSRGTAPDR